MRITSVNKENFCQKVIQSEIPVIISFYSGWSGSCQIVISQLEHIAEEYSERLSVYTVDVEKEKKIADQYDINKIPALLFFDKGKIKASLFGIVSKGAVVEKIKGII